MGARRHRVTPIPDRRRFRLDAAIGAVAERLEDELAAIDRRLSEFDGELARFSRSRKALREDGARTDQPG